MLFQLKAFLRLQKITIHQHFDIHEIFLLIFMLIFLQQCSLTKDKWMVIDGLTPNPKRNNPAPTIYKFY